MSRVTVNSATRQVSASIYEKTEGSRKWKLSHYISGERLSSAQLYVKCGEDGPSLQTSERRVPQSSFLHILQRW